VIAKNMMLAALNCGLVMSQIQRPAPPPRVNPDLSVTYFVDVDASSVVLADSVFSLGPPGLAFTKGADGVWSLTTPPYEAGTHVYGLVIDGVPTGVLNGNNVNDRLPRGYYPFDFIDVRGSDPLFHDAQRVPHGVVHAHTFRSEVLDREVPCYVYTPPGYESSEQNYAVLYLLHGALERASFWTRYSYADRIMDNLIARGEAKELIIVMPDTGAADGGSLPMPLIERYLLEEVIPLFEKKYRIDGAPSARYLGGNSAGANHVRNLAFLHPEMFSAVAIMSGGGLNNTAPPLESTYPKLGDATAFNQQVKLVYIALGERDLSNANIVANVRRLKESLDRLGIRNTFNLSTGGHDWFNWRRYLAEFVKGL
jgi:enterochelin esterase-like enzyme